MTYRILVTGSRDWKDGTAVKEAIQSQIRENVRYGEFVLVHGACPTGADLHAKFVWIAFRKANIPTTLLQAEAYPGRYFPSFKARNQAMVDLGANVCLAFATRWASGTGQTARMARRAGIHTIDYGVNTT